MSMSEVKPTLRIRANASENVKGIISCEATVEVVENSIPTNIVLSADMIAEAIELQLSKMHKVLRDKGHKLAVDGGA